MFRTYLCWLKGRHEWSYDWVERGSLFITMRFCRRCGKSQYFDLNARVWVDSY